jgi:Na+/H+ antiporter NhaD/arsenite permease-like protein
MVGRFFMSEELTTIFGLDPKWLSSIILITIYIILFSEKINRAVIALLGACIMILVGIITQNQALAGIDFNTLSLLIGMMIFLFLDIMQSISARKIIKS